MTKEIRYSYGDKFKVEGFGFDVEIMLCQTGPSAFQFISTNSGNRYVDRVIFGDFKRTFTLEELEHFIKENDSSGYPIKLVPAEPKLIWIKHLTNEM